ncbi:MAG: 2-oxo-4-hydroxy-4-carboxy-5-ureidoimidazoline decarboxylase [Alphaproteobacteria bacterium]
MPRTRTPRLGFETINAMPRTRFVATFGGVFEHSPWIAEAAWKARPFADCAALREAMCGAVRTARRERRLALIRAHPDLAGKAAVAGRLTDESRREQAGAGLDRCTPGEFARLNALNAAYREKFGFPFVMAVRGASRDDILAALAARLDNAPDAEFAAALAEIEKIAGFRLADLVED